MNVFDIKNRIDSDIVKKIFSNGKNAKKYLKILNVKVSSKAKTSELYDEIVKTWDYKKAISIIREIFKETDKFKNGLNGSETVQILLQEWNQLDLGNIEWPFSQGQFDGFVQSINSEKVERSIKDDKVKAAAVCYRRIKEINTERNDFLETLIFFKNENVIPTLSNSKGVDFFINGISFDQKVSRSVTQKFKNDFGVTWKQKAIENPNLVAEYLYTNQDEGRFGCTPRLYIVYLDEDIEPVEIKKIIENTNLDIPLDVTFTYNHKSTGNKTYKTQCFVILLGKQI